MDKTMKLFAPAFVILGTLVLLETGCATGVAAVPRNLPAAQPRTDDIINLLVDCSHAYSFNLSNASRAQSEIFPGINCLTSGRTIHRMDLDPINALVILMDGKLPYMAKDAPAILDYVARGGGVYVGVATGGLYPESLLEFLGAFGLQDAGPRLSKDPANWGISAHAPSELTFEIGGKYARFTSRVGPWADYRGTVAFEVHGDGKKLYAGEVLTSGERETIDIGVRGVKTLRLVATDGGNGKSADGSIWFDPRLVAPSGESTRVLLKDAGSVKVGWAQATQDQHFNGNPLGLARAADLVKDSQGIVATAHKAALPGAALAPSGMLPNVRPVDASAWETVYATKAGDPVVVARTFGHGVIVADLTGLYHSANAKKEPSVAAMRHLIDYMSAGKQVAAMRGGGGWQFSEGYRWELIETTDDGLRIHHNEYTKMFVASDRRAYRESVKYLKQISGLDEKQKAAQIRELNARKAKWQLGTKLDVDISGVQELTLVTTDGGDNINADHAIWADAWFVDAAGKKSKLLLSDASSVKPGYGEATQDALGGGKPFSIGGRVFKTGVFLHANGTMTLPVAGKYARFTSWVGCNDAGWGSVGFKVIGDGKVLWDDGNVYQAGVPGGNPKDVNYIPDGTLFQLKYLACVGSGFLLPQGAAVDMPPALKDDWQVHLGMLAHEMGHAWSYPFGERMGEEGNAFIFNNLILHRHHGQKHGDSVTGRLMNYLKDKGLDEIDLAKKGHNQKYYMFIDLMIREYGEDIWRNYNLLKYALLNKEGAQWTPHETAWLWSIAAGRDVFPAFQTAFGTSVARDKVQLPKAAMALGFDSVALGKLYKVPLKRLTRRRDIFSALKIFADVRAFYAKESKEKGRPEHEG